MSTWIPPQLLLHDHRYYPSYLKLNSNSANPIVLPKYPSNLLNRALFSQRHYQLPVDFLDLTHS